VKWALPFTGMPQLNKKTERFNGVKISLGTAGLAGQAELILNKRKAGNFLKMCIFSK